MTEQEIKATEIVMAILNPDNHYTKERTIQEGVRMILAFTKENPTSGRKENNDR